MAVSSSWYGLQIEKFLNITAAKSLESETETYVILVTDSEVPAFDTHDFYDDITAEVAGTGNYTTGGNVLITTELTVASPGAGQIKYDTADPTWPNSTIASAEAAVIRTEVGASTTDELVLMSDFGAPASTTSGTFDIAVDTNGWSYFDYTP